MPTRALAFLLGLLLVGSADAQTQPWGIAVDRGGAVYVADIYHNNGCVWRIEAGAEPKVVSERRSLDLALDDRGELLTLESPTKSGRGRIWREGVDSPVAAFHLPPSRDGRILSWGEFVPYSQGRYCFRYDQRLWLAQGDKVPVLLSDGREEVRPGRFARTGFLQLLGGLVPLPGGDLLMVDHREILRVTPKGKVATVFDGLLDRLPGDRSPTHPESAHGLAVDADGTLYVAIDSLGVVRRIRPGGRMETATRSEDRWEPMGLALHRGDLYVSESRYVPPISYEGPRVVKVAPTGERTVLANFGPSR